MNLWTPLLLKLKPLSWESKAAHWHGSCVQAGDVQHFHRRTFSEKYFTHAFSSRLLVKPLSWESKADLTVACKLRTSNIFIEGYFLKNIIHAFYSTLLLKPLSWESNLARTVACKLRTSNFSHRRTSPGYFSDGRTMFLLPLPTPYEMIH